MNKKITSYSDNFQSHKIHFLKTHHDSTNRKWKQKRMNPKRSIIYTVTNLTIVLCDNSGSFAKRV